MGYRTCLAFGARGCVMKPIASLRPAAHLILAGTALGLSVLVIAAGSGQPVPRGVVFRVTSLEDAGPGTLRQALLDANATPGADTIVWDVPFLRAGAICLEAPLPIVTDPVTIDGFSQPGASPRKASYELAPPAGAAVGGSALEPAPAPGADEPVILATLDGTGAGDADGLVIDASGCVVRGLSIRGFQRAGVRIAGGQGNRIEENLIAGNGGPGIAIAAGTGQTLHANSIHSNEEDGIDLGLDGLSANDSGDGDGGANGLQNTPLLTGATVAPAPGGSGRVTTVTGTLDSAAEGLFRIELFARGDQDTSRARQGENYLGTFDVATQADGRGSFTVTLPYMLPPRTLISATATDKAGSTSEF